MQIKAKMISTKNLILIFSLLAASASAPNGCSNPTDSKLSNMLAASYGYYLDHIIDGFEYFPPVQSKIAEKFLDIDTSSTVVLASHGEKSCSLKSQINPERTSNCPHHFVEVYREDRYPFVVKKAQCNCDSCLGTDSNYFRCKPVYLVKPVLNKGPCQSNGEYKWSPGFERVPVVCECLEMVEFS